MTIKRIWVDERLEGVLKDLWAFFNEQSIERTGYPIPPGWTITSQLAAEILEKQMRALKSADVNVKKTGRNVREITLQLNRVAGIGKNEITFI